MPPTHVVLFKPTDLRLHDHEPLRAAHEAALAATDEDACVLHLLVLDETLGFGPTGKPSRHAQLARLGALRARFVLQSVTALHKELANRGFDLLIYVGNTADALHAVSLQCDISTIYCHGPELCLEEQLIEHHIGANWCMRLFHGWTLIHIDDLPPTMKRGRNIPGRYKPFLDAVSRGKGPARHRPPLKEPRWTARDLPEAMRRAIVVTPNTRGVGRWGLPASPDALMSTNAAVEPLGVDGEEQTLDRREASGELQRGGEAEALAAMRAYIWEEQRLGRYVGSSDSMTPGVDNALNATTRLSAYLAHGCLSARRLYEEVREYERRRVRNRSTYWVYHELVMRDFLAFSCIDWGTRLFSPEGPLDASGHRWRNPGASETRRLFALWKEGKTGYPFVDAGMRQLARDGWMPHLLRQLCAAFLVRDLRIPWLWGAEWFEQRLVDYTPDANYGNWGYRILPVQQLLANGLSAAHLTSLEILSWPVVHDPHLEYTLRWVPELREVASRQGAIYAREPWRMADGYTRKAKVDVRPKRDSPLWVMSVNRVHWPEYQQMMTGKGYTVQYSPASAEVLHAETCPYPPPLVPPLELELLYEKVPVDHSWGTPESRAVRTMPPPPESASEVAVPLVPPTPSTDELIASRGNVPPRTSCHMVWFRKALRVHDNPALTAAHEAAAEMGVPLLAVFVLDPWFVASGRVGRRRLQFLLESLADLDALLRRTVGIPLLVARGTPSAALPALWAKYSVTRCTWEVDTEPYAKQRDAQVRQLGAKHGVSVHAASGHTLHPLDDLLALCPDGRPPTKYNDFLKLLKAAGPPAQPLPPPSGPTSTRVVLEPSDAASMAVPSTLEEMGCSDRGPDDVSDGSVTPAALGFKLRGGETAALERLNAVVAARPQWVCSFSKPATNPLDYAPGSTSMLSPYLKFGCLSSRTLHAALDAAVASQRQHTEPPQSLHGQLYWREFFYLLAHATPNFGSASGNPLCLHVPWRVPSVDAEAAADLRRWADGTTGIPLVDAAMRQLKEVGWLHHLLRHVVACFLTRGQLWVHWEAGRDLFDTHLLDADWAVNSANWMWLSATCFFHTYHRVYSPAHFARKYDRSGRYVRAWLPALSQMPDQYVYEPWKAPLEVQHACGCVIGRDYPEPICDPDAAAAGNLRRMDECYRSAPEEWKALIPPAASAEVAKERGVKIRPAGGAGASFVPLTGPLQATKPGAEQHRAGLGHTQLVCHAPIDNCAPSPTNSIAVMSLGRMQGGVARREAAPRGRGRGRGGRVSRVQHEWS